MSDGLETSPDHAVLVVHLADQRFGLPLAAVERVVPMAYVQQVPGSLEHGLLVERLRLSSLQPSLSGREFTRGLAPGPIVVLDVEALFANNRFTVDEG